MRYINSSHINRNTAKSGKLCSTPYVKLFVEYYDDEFCGSSRFICDTIEQVKTND